MVTKTKEQNPSNSIASNTPIDDALNKMNETGFTRLLVVEHSKIIGIITLKDLLEYIALKIELETIP